MPIEAWFPLAIYHADLPDSSVHNASLLSAIQGLRASAPAKRTNERSAWTGDLHEVERLHFNPDFAWITNQVQVHVLIYLQSLGVDPKIFDLYIQRSWPVISTKGQIVDRHTHSTSHVSAVYYVSAPGGEMSGRIRFFNEARFNELVGGLTTPFSAALAVPNAFNFQSAMYQPAEGRLLIFPAKLPHDVEANKSDYERVSLSFDIVLTSRPERGPGLYEFLMPSPNQWLRCKRVEDDNVRR
jgi:uncharacterized protein (TIGR02466 family)